MQVGNAGADEGEEAGTGSRAGFLAEVGKRSLSRARRSVTLGPSVGLAPRLSHGSNQLDLQLSFGIDLLRYDIPPVPSPKRLADILKARARDEIARRIKAAMAGGPEPSETDRQRIAREVWAEIEAELLLETRPRTFEKPSFALRLEADYLLDAGSWNVRTMAGLGIGPVFASVGPGMEVDDGVALVFPIELSVPMLVSDGLRSPVVEPFVRAELVATDRADRDDRTLVGVRFLLDIL